MVSGEQFELDTMGGLNYPESKPHIVHQIEIERNENGYSHVSIICDPQVPTTKIHLAFGSFEGVYDFGVGYWYEHSLDAMLGPEWHHAGGGAGGDKIFADLNDEMLQQCLSLIAAESADILTGPASKYLNKTERILKFLVSKKGKIFRANNADVQQSYDDKKRRDKVYKTLSRA
jgi:hypothetical protein